MTFVLPQINDLPEDIKKEAEENPEKLKWFQKMSCASYLKTITDFLSETFTEYLREKDPKRRMYLSVKLDKIKKECKEVEKLFKQLNTES